MSFFDEDTTEQHERRVRRCRGCNAMIIWFMTDDGRNVPVDADTVEAADDELDLSRHVAHFSTCKRSAQFRRAQ